MTEVVLDLQMKFKSFDDSMRKRLVYGEYGEEEGSLHQDSQSRPFIDIKKALENEFYALLQKINKKETSEIKKLFSLYMYRALIAVNSREYKFSNDDLSTKIVRVHVVEDGIILDRMSKEILRKLDQISK